MSAAEVALPAVAGQVVAGQVVAGQVVAALRRAGATVASAESLTGGLVTAALTAVPGASAVVRGGVVAYATDLKATLLGVPDALLRARGPVDPQVAAAMALGVRRACAATWGVATTGVAGPDPQGGQPVGTVYVAAAGSVAAAGPQVIIERWQLLGDRAAIRAATVRAALLLVARMLDGGEQEGEQRPAPRR